MYFFHPSVFHLTSNLTWKLCKNIRCIDPYSFRWNSICYFAEPDFHYPFDKMENGAIAGSTAGITTGAVELVDGKVNRALYTNGINQYVNLGNLRQYCVGNILHCQNGLTVSFWINPLIKKPGNLFYLDNGGSTSWSIGMNILQQNEALCATVRDDSRVWSVTGVSFVPMHWYHVIVVWGEASGLHFYLNGCLAAVKLSPTFENSNPNGPHNDLILGTSTVSSLKSMTMSEMLMDELEIWDAEFAQEQVWNIFVSRL